jgi:hypothetical protein
MTPELINCWHAVASHAYEIGGTNPELCLQLYQNFLAAERASMLAITPPALPRVRTRKKGATIQKNPASTVPARSRGRPRRQNGAGASQSGDISINEATLNAVNAMPSWSTTEQIRTRVKDQYGMNVRSNHIGVALTRHKKAGRIAMVGPEKGPGKKWAPVASTGSLVEQQNA